MCVCLNKHVCNLLILQVICYIDYRCALSLPGPEHFDESPLPHPRMQAPKVLSGTERLPKDGPVLQ